MQKSNRQLATLDTDRLHFTLRKKTHSSVNVVFRVCPMPKELGPESLQEGCMTFSKTRQQRKIPSLGVWETACS